MTSSVQKDRARQQIAHLHATAWRGADAGVWGAGVEAVHRGGTTPPLIPLCGDPAP